MTKFEVVNKFKNSKIDLIPKRKTAKSAGYDFVVAEDITIPAYLNSFWTLALNEKYKESTLNEVAAITKKTGIKPTLVSSGVKCALEPNQYLELSVRSSTPLKYWLILANSVGIIDADYYNNEDNEGEIFFQLINLSPWPISLKAGDVIGQGIIKQYQVTDEDSAKGTRKGGFGSTDKDLNFLAELMSGDDCK